MAGPTTPRAAVRLRRPVVDVSFPALGSTVRLIASGPAAQRVVARARADILDYHARLSRFLPGSELSALNRDPRPTVPASALLRDALRAALWAAGYSDGLVDPCVHDALVAAGYGRSYERPAQVPAPAGPHRAARPDPAARWRAIRVDEAAGTVARPPGLRLDLGGTGKGHVADLVARRLAACGHWVVDCGGDVRVGGARPVQVAHPLRAEPAAELVVADAALATSSVMSRAWLRDDGRPAHHLLDPSTGLPVRTGLLCASAVAPTTLHAETLAKLALLLGPERARPLLGGHGGVLVYEDGSVETVAPRGRTAA
jgi:thiamine biosynthesis lipoprotein